MSNRVEHQFRGIVTLDRKECRVGLETFFIPGHKILHRRHGAVHKEAVDEHGSIDRRIVCAGEILRIPSICAEEGHFHVVEIELGGDDAGVGCAAWNEDRIETRCVENFLVQLCQFPGQFRLIERHG